MSEPRPARKRVDEKCFSCGDPLATECKICGPSARLIYCKECHLEIVHGKITPQFMRSQFGGGRDPWWDDEAYDGWGQNARRALEGD